MIVDTDVIFDINDSNLANRPASLSNGFGINSFNGLSVEPVNFSTLNL